MLFIKLCDQEGNIFFMNSAYIKKIVIKERKDVHENMKFIAIAEDTDGFEWNASPRGYKTRKEADENFAKESRF